MCAEAKTNRISLNPIEQLWDEQMATQPGSFRATSESWTALGCSPLKLGADSQERCATLRAFNSASL